MNDRACWNLVILAVIISNSLVLVLVWAVITGALPLTLNLAVLLAALFPMATISGLWLISKMRMGS